MRINLDLVGWLSSSFHSFRWRLVSLKSFVCVLQYSAGLLCFMAKPSAFVILCGSCSWKNIHREHEWHRILKYNYALHMQILFILQRFAVGLLAPSQRYSRIEGEEACRLWPEKKWLLEKVKYCVVVVPKMEIMSLGFYLKVIYKSISKESCISQCQQCQKVGVGTTPNARK